MEHAWNTFKMAVEEWDRELVDSRRQVRQKERERGRERWPKGKQTAVIDDELVLMSYGKAVTLRNINERGLFIESSLEGGESACVYVCVGYVHKQVRLLNTIIWENLLIVINI